MYMETVNSQTKFFCHALVLQWTVLQNHFHSCPLIVEDVLLLFTWALDSLRFFTFWGASEKSPISKTCVMGGCKVGNKYNFVILRPIIAAQLGTMAGAGTMGWVRSSQVANSPPLAS